MRHWRLKYPIEELITKDYADLCRKIDGAHIHGTDAERSKNHLKVAIDKAKSGQFADYTHIMITNSGIECYGGRHSMGHSSVMW
jgi:hypothetical protein